MGDEVTMVPAPPGHQEGRGRRHGGEGAQARDVAAGALHRVPALPGLEVAIVGQPGGRKLNIKNFDLALFTTIFCQNFLNGFYCKIKISKEEC